MSTTRRSMLGATAIGLSLVAAACGGDDSGGGGGAETAGTVDQGVSKGVEDALSGSSTSAAGDTTDTTAAPEKTPTSMAEWEALWAKQRETIVKRIKDNKWGLSADGKTVTGPEGFTIDLSKCPAGWSATEGMVDGQIKIGQAIAQSGTLASYGQIAKGITVHMDTINKAGGIKDASGKSWTVSYTAKDDGYDAARTIPLVDELIDSEKVWAASTRSATRPPRPG